MPPEAFCRQTLSRRHFFRNKILNLTIFLILSKREKKVDGKVGS
jgi:hypothetical protein